MFKNKNKKFSWRILVAFIAFQIIFSGVCGTLFVFYGPFTNLKSLVVGTSDSSYTCKFIARIFLSEKQITNILHPNIEGENTLPTAATTQDISNITIPKNVDNTIERYDIDSKNYKGYVLLVHDATRVKVGYSQYIGSQGQRTSEIAEQNGAVAAINGGGFIDSTTDGKLWVGTGKNPTGLVMADGKVIYNDSPVDVPQTVMAFTKEGKMVIGTHTTTDLIKMGVTQAISFGPPIIINGNSQVQGDGGQGITARTAIGQKKTGEVILVVLDGRRINMPGATLKDVENVMRQYEAYNAINLDGGSSTTMYYKGEVINNPCNPFGERTIATVVYVSR